MITLDVADLVVIAGQALGTGDTALRQLDTTAAQAALAEARPAGADSGTVFGDQSAAAGAGIGLMHALLRHPPFPADSEPVAVAAALQFLSLNGWRADLSPPGAAAVVVEALAAGQLSPDSAAAWLASRLSPQTVPRAWQVPMCVPLPRVRLPRAIRLADLPATARMLVSAVLTIAVGGMALLATACASGPATPATHPARIAPTHARLQHAPVTPSRIVIGGTGRRG